MEMPKMMPNNTAKVQPEICEAVAVVPTKDRFGSAGTVLAKLRVRPNNNNNTHTQLSSHKNLHLSNSVVLKERTDTE